MIDVDEMQLEPYRGGFLIRADTAHTELMLKHFGRGVVLNQGRQEYTLTFHPHEDGEAVGEEPAPETLEPVEFDPEVIVYFLEDTPLDGDQERDDEGDFSMEDDMIGQPPGPQGDTRSALTEIGGVSNAGDMIGG